MSIMLLYFVVLDGTYIKNGLRLVVVDCYLHTNQVSDLKFEFEFGYVG